MERRLPNSGESTTVPIEWTSSRHALDNPDRLDEPRSPVFARVHLVKSRSQNGGGRPVYGSVNGDLELDTNVRSIGSFIERWKVLPAVLANARHRAAYPNIALNRTIRGIVMCLGFSSGGAGGAERWVGSVRTCFVGDYLLGHVRRINRTTMRPRKIDYPAGAVGDHPD